MFLAAPMPPLVIIDPVEVLVESVVLEELTTPDVLVFPESVTPDIVGLVESTTVPDPVVDTGEIFVAVVNCAMFPLVGEPLDVTAFAGAGSPYRKYVDPSYLHVR